MSLNGAGRADVKRLAWVPESARAWICAAARHGVLPSARSTAPPPEQARRPRGSGAPCPACRSDPATAFVELGGIKLSEVNLDEVLQRVAELAKRVLPMPVEVSVTLIRGGVGHTAAFTSEVARDMDERQYAHGPWPVPGRRRQRRCRVRPRSLHRGPVARVGRPRPEAGPGQFSVDRPADPGGCRRSAQRLRAHARGLRRRHRDGAGDVRRVRRGRPVQRPALRQHREPRPADARGDGQPGGHRAGQGHHHGRAALRPRRGVRDPVEGLTGLQPQGP